MGYRPTARRRELREQSRSLESLGIASRETHRNSMITNALHKTSQPRQHLLCRVPNETEDRGAPNALATNKNAKGETPRIVSRSVREPSTPPKLVRAQRSLNVGSGLFLCRCLFHQACHGRARPPNLSDDGVYAAEVTDLSRRVGLCRPRRLRRCAGVFRTRRVR